MDKLIQRTLHSPAAANIINNISQEELKRLLYIIHCNCHSLRQDSGMPNSKGK